MKAFVVILSEARFSACFRSLLVFRRKTFTCWDFLHHSITFEFDLNAIPAGSVSKSPAQGRARRHGQPATSSGLLLLLLPSHTPGHFGARGKRHDDTQVVKNQ